MHLSNAFKHSRSFALLEKSILKKQSGFTLLELLIVIVIIGILALLIIPNITSAPKKARDTQRKTDLKAVQKALEEYYISNSSYPTQVAAANADTILTTPLATGTPPIIKAIPKNPTLTGDYKYTYQSAAGADYYLRSCLENGSEASSASGPITTDASTCPTSKRLFTLRNSN